MNERAGDTAADTALAMLNTFASIGATAFDVTLLDIEGRKQNFRPQRSLADLRRSLSAQLDAATRTQTSIVIRPRSTTHTPIQLDDLKAPQIEMLKPHAFLVLETSPENFQAWVAVQDAPQEKEAAKEFAKRLRKGAGADHSATGATRVAGSLNFKTKYAPHFPTVAIRHAHNGHVVSIAELEHAHLLAPVEIIPLPLPPASVPPRIVSAQPNAGRKWPDWQQALRGAPLKSDGSGPDRSRADFMFCKWAIERGWSVEDTADKLLEVSSKAQDGIRLKNDHGYPLLTARNAAAAVERERTRRHQSVPPARRLP
jgi:hypothetical protein